jgi:CheY-like chemotaxis protein
MLKKTIASSNPKKVENSCQLEQPRKRVLYFENDAITALTQKIILSKYGYDVTHASSGEKGVNFINNGEVFDLILSDIELGKGIDGPEAIKQILQKINIPVLFLTMYDYKEIEHKINNISHYGCINKQSEEAHLVEALDLALRTTNNQLVTDLK